MVIVGVAKCLGGGKENLGQKSFRNWVGHTKPQMGDQ